MGRDLFEQSAAARAVFEAVDAACGRAVSRLCFEGPDEALKRTENAQPALFAVSVAALAGCREVGLEPAAAAGHSVGEYAALVAAGAFTAEAGARLVKARGEAMADAAGRRAGTMAAVLGPDAATVEASCLQVVNEGVVVPANYNAPGQIVISGEVPAVEAASALLKQRGARRVVPLAVSGAFHSPLMEPAAAVLKGVLELTDVHEPRLPVVANVTADYVRTAADVRQSLAAQVAGPVRWVETVERLAGDGYAVFIECGPGNVLAGLIKRIAPEAVVLSAGDVAAVRDAAARWASPPAGGGSR
jgi:[acyl-carrier-protein] S-malonyltransferase